MWVAEKFSVGRYAMFLQPWKDVTVSQVISDLPPGDYRLSFNYMARPNHPGNTQIWLGTKKLGEVESDATMRRFSTDFSLPEKQENVLFKFFSPARDAEKDIAIENVVLQRLDASIGDAKYPDLLTAMIHAADGDTIVYSPADGDAERIADALARRFISYDSVYWGATLDARCEDGESCQSAFMGFEALLRSAVKRGDRDASAKWERCVRHALDMSLTYMVSWDIPTPEGSDLFNHAFRSTGWMMVSPQNQCMDCLGAIEAPATWRMGVYWKDRRLQDLAKLRFSSGCQLLDEEGASGENIQLTNFGNLLDDHRHPPRDSDAAKFRGVYRDSWEMLWMTAIHMKAGCEFMLMGVDW